MTELSPSYLSSIIPVLFYFLKKHMYLLQTPPSRSQQSKLVKTSQIHLLFSTCQEHFSKVSEETKSNNSSAAISMGIFLPERENSHLTTPWMKTKVQCTICSLHHKKTPFPGTILKLNILHCCEYLCRGKVAHIQGRGGF